MTAEAQRRLIHWHGTGEQRGATRHHANLEMTGQRSATASRSCRACPGGSVVQTLRSG